MSAPLLLLRFCSSHSATHQASMLSCQKLTELWIVCRVPLCVGCQCRKILIAFSSDGLRWSPWQTVFGDGLAGHNRATQGDVKYPSLLALSGDDNEVLGETFAVAFQYSGPATLQFGNTSLAPFAFHYVNVSVTATSDEEFNVTVQ